MGAGFEKIHQKFEVWLKTEPYSPNTREIYARITRKFLSFLNSFDIYSLSDVSKDLAVQYTTQRGGKMYAKTNIKLRQSAMTLFYAWAYANRYCQADLMVEYKKAEMYKKPFPKTKKKDSIEIITILTPEEQRALLNTETNDSFTTARNICMISIILMGALYTEDLLKLSVKNINLEEGYIDIGNKKPGKRRIQITSRECKLACKNWLPIRNTVFHKKKSSLLFFTKSLSPITRRTFYRIVSKSMEDANIDYGDIGPKILRQTAIFNMLDSGKTIEEVQEITGLKTLKNIQKYYSVT